MLQDLRYGVRMLLKHKGFTAVAVLSLALGIGANTAIFSLIDAVLLKMLPVGNPEQLVFLETSGPKSPKAGSNISYPLFTQLRDHSQVSSDMLTFLTIDRLNASVDGQAEVVGAQVVSGNYYDLLGVRPILGRILTAADDRVPGGHSVAVISYGYWQQRFARDPSAVGKEIDLNGNPFTIIGVTPPEFFGVDIGSSPSISVPLMMLAQVNPGTSASLAYNSDPLPFVIARLKPGVTAQQATTALTALLQQIVITEAGSQLSPEKRSDLQGRQIELTPASQGLSGLRLQFSKPLHALMAVVGLVLLIACANIANLLLARAGTRQKEIALRLALGASRLRLVRQLMTESFLLSLLGGSLGLLFAYWGNDVLVNLVSGGRDRMFLQLTPDARVLGFTAAVSLMAGLLFGLAPALRATRADLALTLKGGTRTFARRGLNFGLGKLLVVAQVALSLLLLIGAGLFVRSLEKLKTLDVGFDREKVLLFSVDPALIGYKGPQSANLHKQVLQQIATLAGVRLVSHSRQSLFSNTRTGSSVYVQGRIPLAEELSVSPGMANMPNISHVGPRFFETMGMPLVQGRDFGEQDHEQAPKVAVVNETFARYYFGDESPVGRRFGKKHESSGEIEIVGVVKDAKYLTLREETPRMFYVPYLQEPSYWGRTTYVVRTTGPPTDLVTPIRFELQAIDKNLPVAGFSTLSEKVNESLRQERLVSALSSFFGLLALVLACVGLYGILSYAVSRKTREIGIRMALGAQRRHVLWEVLRETLSLTLAGVAIGLCAAVGTTRLIASMLFGLTPTDPVTLLVATLFLIGVAIVAGYLPARRAARVNPMVALRYE